MQVSTLVAAKVGLCRHVFWSPLKKKTCFVATRRHYSGLVLLDLGDAHLAPDYNRGFAGLPWRCEKQPEAGSDLPIFEARKYCKLQHIVAQGALIPCKFQCFLLLDMSDARVVKDYSRGFAGLPWRCEKKPSAGNNFPILEARK